MAKNILIISTSLRSNSNSEKLAKAFMAGAESNGNTVELVSLKDKKIAFCKGCMACQKLGKCVINDDANIITEKMFNADVIVWATPIYYYEMSGSMKTMIDRANSLYSREYKFRDVYLLTTAADTELDATNRCIEGLLGWVECFENAKFCDYIFANGADAPNSISQEKLDEAYSLGESIE